MKLKSKLFIFLFFPLTILAQTTEEKEVIREWLNYEFFNSTDLIIDDWVQEPTDSMNKTTLFISFYSKKLRNSENQEKQEELQTAIDSLQLIQDSIIDRYIVHCQFRTNIEKEDGTFANYQFKIRIEGGEILDWRLIQAIGDNRDSPNFRRN